MLRQRLDDLSQSAMCTWGGLAVRGCIFGRLQSRKDLAPKMKERIIQSENTWGGCEAKRGLNAEKKYIEQDVY